MTPDDGALEELLGAYALHACDPEETAAVEELLRRRPDLAEEADRLAAAAAWLGALEASEPPAVVRDAVLAAASDDTRDAVRLYDAEARRLDDELAALDAGHYDVVTANGLSAWSLAVHLAAQESMLARAVGAPVDDVETLDVEARTAVMLDRFRNRPLDAVLGLWRAAVAAVLSSVRGQHSTSTVLWLGQPMSRADALTARAFENWVHRDDLRRVRGASSAPPAGSELALMADLAMRTLPAGLAAGGRARPGHSARIVLTGEGGGTWHLALDPTQTAVGTPDVTLRASALDWCLVAAERLAPGDLPHTVEGDPELADDLVTAAPALATL